MPGYCRSPSCQGLSGAVSEFCANCRSCCTHETRGSSPSRQHVAGVFVSPFATEDAQRGRDGPAPDQWVVVTRDLWKEFGPMKLTGIAPTAMGGDAYFDRIELLASLEEE